MRVKLTKCLLAPIVRHRGAHRSLEVLEVPLVTALMEARLEEWRLEVVRGWGREQIYWRRRS